MPNVGELNVKLVPSRIEGLETYNIYDGLVRIGAGTMDTSHPENGLSITKGDVKDLAGPKYANILTLVHAAREAAAKRQAGLKGGI